MLWGRRVRSYRRKAMLNRGIKMSTPNLNKLRNQKVKTVTHVNDITPEKMRFLLRVANQYKLTKPGILVKRVNKT